jgi:hypothetical protein
VVGIVAALVLVGLSLVVTRVGSAALEATGVSPDLAHFQARSAFTGVGYTTTEAESVVTHPLRRRIVLLLMLLGNAGLVSVVASLVLGFSDTGGRRDAFLRLGVLVVGLGVLFVLTRTELFTHLVKRGVQLAARRWTGLEVRDYVSLLDVSHGYAIHDVEVDEGSWLAHTELRELDLPSEGVLVLGIRTSDGEFVGAPRPDTSIDAGDTVLLYGREEALAELRDRERGGEGDVEHEGSARRHDEVQDVEHSRRERARGGAG